MKRNIILTMLAMSLLFYMGALKGKIENLTENQIALNGQIHDLNEEISELKQLHQEGIKDGVLLNFEANRGECVDRTPMNVPNIGTSFKTYMDYRTITDKSSLQYKYITMSDTDENGFLRIGYDYVIAIGSYYSYQCGDRFEITLDTGKVFTAIVGDIKANQHTNDTRQYIKHNGNMIEFIVDADKINSKCKVTGNMSFGDMEGKVIGISKIV